MEVRLKYILAIFALIISLIFSLTPLLFMLVVSFAEDINFMLGKDYNITLRNYVDIIKKEDLYFLRYILNSLIISSTSALISLFVSSLSAYTLSRLSSRPLLFLSLLLFVSMFPPISTVGFLFNFYSLLGIINTYLALILTYIAWSLPMGVWVMFSYFSKLPKDIDRAAIIDGANHLFILFKILFPLSKPALVSCYILLFLFAFNEFMFAYIFTIDHTSRTITVGIALFEGIHGQVPWGYIMAGASISVMPVLIVVLMLQKYIIEGLVKGAVR